MASEMVGEILKLAISVTLVTVFSLGVYAYLPEERVPYLEIETSWHDSTHTVVDITHAGGDTLQSSDITIQIMNAEDSSQQKTLKLSEIKNTDIWRFPETRTIDLSLYFTTIPGKVAVTVIHPRAILAEGTVYNI